ncbi:MAG: hypothetical protein WCT77_09095 [Bacteroidota bacterium]
MTTKNKILLFVIFTFVFLFNSIYTLAEENFEDYRYDIELYCNEKIKNAVKFSLLHHKEIQRINKNGGITGLQYFNYYISNLLTKNNLKETFAYDTLKNEFIQLTNNFKIINDICKIKKNEFQYYDSYCFAYKYHNKLFLNNTIQYHSEAYKQILFLYTKSNEKLIKINEYYIDNLALQKVFVQNGNMHFIFQKCENTLDIWYYLLFWVPRGRSSKWKEVCSGPKYEYIFNDKLQVVKILKY